MMISKRKGFEMPDLKRINVEVVPYYTARPNDVTLYECRIIVECFPNGNYQLRELIPSDDFTRRFDYLMDRAKMEVTKYFTKDEKIGL